GGALTPDVRGPVPARAVVATTARRRRRIVELAPEILLPAGAGRDVVEHRLLLAPAFGADPLVAFTVVRPRPPRGRPAALHTADRTVHVEDLEHHLQAAPAEIDHRLQRARGQGTARLLQDGEGLAHHRLGRERQAREVGPDV